MMTSESRKELWHDYAKMEYEISTQWKIKAGNDN